MTEYKRKDFIQIPSRTPNPKSNAKSYENETERQWGNPRGQQGVTVMTQHKRGVCLNTLFHNCHFKQTLENPRLLNTGENQLFSAFLSQLPA